MWKQWISAIIGLGVIAVPFMGFAIGTMMWTLVVAGVIVTVLSLWSAYEVSEGTSRGMSHAHS